MVSYVGSPELKPCLVRMACKFCNDDLTCLETARDAKWADTQEVTLAGTRLQYECPAGKKFDGYDDYQVIEANWDGSWDGLMELRTCVCEW